MHRFSFYDFDWLPYDRKAPRIYTIRNTFSYSGKDYKKYAIDSSIALRDLIALTLKLVIYE
jgi:hypothetical protein